MDATESWESTPDRVRVLPSRLLGATSTVADRLVHERLATVGARKWHYPVLAALADLGPMSQAALSRRTGIYRSDMVAVVNELEGRGHVERTPDPGDRRRNVITATERGAAHTTTLERLIAEGQDALLAPLSAAERDHLTELLDRVMSHHARRAARPSP